MLLAVENVYSKTALDVSIGTFDAGIEAGVALPVTEILAASSKCARSLRKLPETRTGDNSTKVVVARIVVYCQS
jgi:hypothetical protein